MATTILTQDQRWLLRAVGGWQMRDCLIGPDGVDHLMQSMYGSTGVRINGAPDWLHGFQCGRGKIQSIGIPAITVTAAQLNRYASRLDAELKAELIKCRGIARTEDERVRKWCHCGRESECLKANQDDPFWGDRYHPTASEVDDHYEKYWQIRDRTDDLLDLALGFETVDEPLGQLKLFEVAS